MDHSNQLHSNRYQEYWYGNLNFLKWLLSFFSLTIRSFSEKYREKKSNNYNIIPFWRRMGSHISFISCVVIWCQIRERHVYSRHSKKVNWSNARMIECLFKALSLALFGLNVFEIFKNTNYVQTKHFSHLWITISVGFDVGESFTVHHQLTNNTTIVIIPHSNHTRSLRFSCYQ